MVVDGLSDGFSDEGWAEDDDAGLSDDGWTEDDGRSVDGWAEDDGWTEDDGWAVVVSFSLVLLWAASSGFSFFSLGRGASRWIGSLASPCGPC